MVRSKKDKINMLMNIDNYFGEHKGRLAPIIIFLVLSTAPFFLYILFLSSFVPLKYAAVFELIWSARMAMLTLGRENERLAQFEAQQNDEYVSAEDLVRISHQHDDGLIEYMNGRVAYAVIAYGMSYINDDSFSIDFERFLDKLSSYETDIYCHLVVDEFKLQNNLSKVKVYRDREVMQERMMFYMTQDEYCKKNSQLYRFCFVIKTSKYDWKTLRAHLETILRSETSDVFKISRICSKEEVSDVISRDLCTNVDLGRMLVNKFRNENYYGSKVMYYGEDMPEEFKKKKDEVQLNARRVVMKEEQD